VAAVVTLQPDEAVPGRPFTDVQHTQTDTAILRYLVAHLEMTLDSKTPDEENQRPLERYFPTARQWWQRVMVTQPEKLAMTRPLIIVGFFGQRRHNLSESMVKLVHTLDKSLISELPSYEDLLAYCTLALPTGNYSNLVVFTNEEGIKLWPKSKKHSDAVRELTPNYYLSVRLYNGLLPSGLRRVEELRLTLVKYYDYQEIPQWRAFRPFQ
jgi:hypothetical protein